MPLHPSELDFRRRWYQAHVRRFESDPALVQEATDRQAGFARSAGEALGNLESLRRTRDPEAFRAAMQTWAVKPATMAFNGFAGQMLLNQLVKRSNDPYRLGVLLAECLTAPASEDEATVKIRTLVEQIEAVRTGAQPAPRSAAFLLSYFWALSDRKWPIHWTSAASFTEYVAGIGLPNGTDERYREFCVRVRELDDDCDRIERVARWWEREHPVIVDPVLVDRCAFGIDPDGMEHDDLARNAAALTAFAKYARELGADVEKAAGRPLQGAAPGQDWKEGRPRSDAWVDWTDGRSAPGIRVWINQRGLAIGIKPGRVRTGWYDEAAATMEKDPPPGFRMLAARGGRHGEDAGFVGGASGEFLYGRFYDRDRLDEIDLRDELVTVTAEARPALDSLIALARGEEEPAPETFGNDPLIVLAEEFRRWGYPSAGDDKDRADRAYFASLLSDGTLPDQDPRELGKIWNTGRYGGPGPMAALNRSAQDTDTYERLLDTFRYLCHGDGEDADRIDAALDDPKWKVPGLGESVIMKLLAITHPERYLAVFPYKGEKGKQRLLHMLGLPEPTAISRGRVQVEANDRLRKRVEALFPGDPWGMSRFLFWYAARDPEQDEESDKQTDPIADLAEELLLDRSFLDDVVELLRDKGQVILYGPPGTGKTYIAKKLAAVLAPDQRRRSIVQFHPSTSYEDFVEGYRPETVNGTVTYSLTDGPLRRLASRAKDAPGTRHVMLIDEINRGNLPKILGELLFLLEYRGEQIGTLYRPDEAFELPPDLWFIGTMNTADRSVALIDAALRRRFHFVPVYPESGPMEGLLRRWLDHHHEPSWVADLVAMVNAELIDTLGGPHLQIGPSHFMRRGLDEVGIERIWRYNVEPFVEDQFFGDQARIEHFRYTEVRRRHRELAGEEGVVTPDAEQ
jgi:5-methylcytosine-specific restriction protein B